MITNNDILDAIAAMVEQAFPGEPVYRDFAPSDFERPSSLVELSGGTPACQPEEVADIRFLPFEDALAALTHPSDRDTLQKAHAFLEGR